MLVVLSSVTNNKHEPRPEPRNTVVSEKFISEILLCSYAPTSLPVSDARTEEEHLRATFVARSAFFFLFLWRPAKERGEE
jgi:hypothetical protein